MGHGHELGDVCAWKERPVSYHGGLKVKASSWKQGEKLSLLEEATCDKQTEN